MSDCFVYIYNLLIASLLFQISNVSDTRMESLAKRFEVGQKVEARVLGHHLLDGIMCVYLGTAKF